MTTGNIKKALADRHQNNAWLLDEVHKLGLTGLTPQNLSKVIRGTYEGSKTYRDTVMTAIESVLKPARRARTSKKKAK